MSKLKTKLDAFARSLPSLIARTNKWIYSVTPKKLAQATGLKEEELPDYIERIVKIATKSAKREVRCKIETIKNGSSAPRRYTFYFYAPGWLGDALEWASDYLALAERLYDYIYPGQKPRIQTIASWARKLKKSRKSREELHQLISWLHETHDPYVPSIWDVNSFLTKYPALLRCYAKEKLDQLGIKLGRREKIKEITHDKIITTNRVIELSKGGSTDEGRATKKSPRTRRSSTKVLECEA